jgi:hypothetical protein
MARVLVKANDDLVSFCVCNVAFATQGQADCPWCGCGWLFSCSRCRRAFTFAKVIDTTLSIEAVATMAVEGFYGRHPRVGERQRLAEEKAWIEHWANASPRDETLVFLDGRVLASGAENVKLEGRYARHRFARLPHVTARTKADIDATLGNPAYWRSRARRRR